MNELFQYYPISEYFTPVCGELVKVSIETIIANTSDQRVTYRCSYYKGMIDLESPVNFFLTKEDFKENKPSPKNTFFPTVVASDLNCRINHNKDNFSGWGVGRNVIEEYTFRVTTVMMEKGGKLNYGFSVDNYKTLPDQLYPSRDEAIDNNIIDVVESDGSVNTMVGWKTTIRLTEQQKAAVKSLEENLKQLQDLNVALIYDRDFERLRAINVNDYDYFSDFEDSGEEFYKQVYAATGESISSTNIIWVDEYNCLSLNKKNKE